MKYVILLSLFIVNYYYEYVLCLTAKTREFLKLEKSEFFDEIKFLIRQDKPILKILNEDITLAEYGSITQDQTEKYSFLLNSEKQTNKNNLVSEIYFYKNLKQKGWDKLSLFTYRGDEQTNIFSSFKQAYFAGYLEGRISFQDIYNFHNNIVINYKNKKLHPLIKEIKNFLKLVNENMLERIDVLDDLSKQEKDYYYKIYIFYCQILGLFQGYNKQVNLILQFNTKTEFPVKNLKIEDILLVQSDGEIPELMRYFLYKKFKNSYKLEDRLIFKKIFNIDSRIDDPNRLWKRVMWRSRCSAYIKLLKNEDNKITDLFSGHNAWTEYTETYRSFKNYNFDFYDDLNSRSLKVNAMFSSYPGCISSTDDYFITDKKLFVTETTLEVIDMNAYKKVKSEREFIPNFLRINAATLFSNTGEEWVNNFVFLNSGTYSSQWMILDYKVFDKIKNNTIDDQFPEEKVRGLLYVLEQVPNSIKFHDISDKLVQKGYYASFNRAFFSETKSSVNEDLVRELYGDAFTSKGSERAKIFKRLNKNVRSFKDFKDLLRYNGYKLNRTDFIDDPSNKSPGNGISARYDLDSEYNLSGGIDCKLTNDEMIKNLSSAIISGPTNENNENLKLFSWDDIDEKNKFSIDGLPNTYNFDWLLASPNTLKENTQNDKFEF